MLAYLNGRFLSRSAAQVSVEDRGFIFGDGVYEVWRAVNGRLFETERHVDRLAFGLRELRIARPEIVTVAGITELAERLLTQSGLSSSRSEATLYVQVTRGAAPRSHQFPPATTAPTVYATVNPFNPPEKLRSTGAACISIPDIRWSRCDIKTIQLLPNVLAKQEAVESGALDALMVRDGVVTEGSHANVMAVIDGAIRTHPTDNKILPGITRAIVLELAREAGVAARETPFAEAELATVDELFLVGTTTDVMPLVRVNGRQIGAGTPGPITQRLVRAFREYLDAACSVASAAR